MKYPTLSPLSGPPVGRPPGFNTGHPAAFKCTYSGVAKGAELVQIYGPAPGKVATVSAGTPTASIDGNIGQCVGLPAVAGNYLTVSGVPGVADTTITIASIFQFTTIGGASFNIQAIGSNGSATYTAASAYNTSTTHFEVLVNGGSAGIATSTFPAATVKTPYFYVFSCSGTTFNFVLKNLSTGGVWSETVTGTAMSGTNTSTYEIGNLAGASNCLAGNIAAIMYSRAYMSKQELTRWADDPWRFWYPERI